MIAPPWVHKINPILYLMQLPTEATNESWDEIRVDYEIKFY